MTSSCRGDYTGLTPAAGLRGDKPKEKEMKLDINRACGHHESHTFFGGHYAEQRTRLEQGLCAACAEQRTWLEQGLCVACYEDAQVALRAIESARAAELAINAGLPPLRGTPRQVAWAEQIREHRYEEILAMNAVVTSELAASVLAALPDSAIEATYWINSRDEMMRNLPGIREAGLAARAAREAQTNR